MGIIFMFFGEQIRNIGTGIPWEVGNKDVGKLVSIAHTSANKKLS